MKLQDDNREVVIDINAFIDAVVDGMFWGRSIHHSGYTAMERATPNLVSLPYVLGKPSVTMSDVWFYFAEKYIDHPGTGSRGGQWVGIVQSVDRHVRGLIKCGTLKIVGAEQHLEEVDFA